MPNERDQNEEKNCAQVMRKISECETRYCGVGAEDIAWRIAPKTRSLINAYI